MSFNEILSKLNYKKENIHFKGEGFKNLDKLDYDFLFHIDGEALVIFSEVFDKNDISKQVKNFWNFSDIPVLVIKFKDDYLIFNSHIFKKDKSNIWMSLKKDEFQELFRSEMLCKGEFFKKFEKDFKVKNHVFDYLVKNINIAYDRLSEKKDGIDLIFKLIFIRVLIDRQILNRKVFFKLYNKSFEDLICDRINLKRFFTYLKMRFGGDLFEIVNLKSDDLKIIHSLFTGNDLEFNQSILFDVYDFSIIPNELIGNIYENIGKSKGIYHTPSSIVEYMESKIKLDKIYPRVLDPSCGSGVFLTKTFKKIAGHFKITGKKLLKTLKKCIYGVDSDEVSVNITILSIYITLIELDDDLDNFKFPHLKNTNIIHCDFFKKQIKDLGKFDIIIANPPWFQARGKKHPFEKLNYPITNRQIAEGFIIRSAEFIKKDGTIILLLTSKILYNTRDVKFRRYLLNKFAILEIADLTLIRHMLFKITSWPCFILTYSKNKHINTLKHISFKENFQIKYLKRLHYDLCDVTNLGKSEFLKDDWLFKALLVGKTEDITLIKKLNKNISLGDFISSHPHLKAGVGLKKSVKNEGRKMSEFLDKPYLKISNNDLKRYCITPSAKWSWEYVLSGDKSLLKPPFVLMKGSFTSSFDFIACYCSDEIVFDYNTFAIKGNWSDEVLLKNITALINSSLFKYYFLMTGNVGVEKNKSTFSERKKFPLHKSIIDNHHLYEAVIRKERGVDLKDDKIDSIIYKSYGLDKSEIDLINDAISRIAPKRRKKHLKSNLDKLFKL